MPTITGGCLCGKIRYRADAEPAFVGLCLDDPSWVKPTTEIYCSSAQPWVQLGGEMKSFDKAPG